MALNNKVVLCSSERDIHSMLIRSACPAHGGVYKAVISNKLGKAACYAHLYVTGTDEGFMSDAIAERCNLVHRCYTVVYLFGNRYCS